MKLLFAIAILAAIAPAGAKADQPDLNMDDLRTFSRRFCIKTGACAQPLHPNIEDRRTSDTTLWAPAVPHALTLQQMPQARFDARFGKSWPEPYAAFSQPRRIIIDLAPHQAPVDPNLWPFDQVTDHD